MNKAMIYHHGFLDDDLKFIPSMEASPEQMRLAPFHSWYEFSGNTQRGLMDWLKTAIESLPSPFVFMTSQSILDNAVVKLARSLRQDFRTVTVENEFFSQDLVDWVNSNRYRYFLSDSHQARVLFVAERLLQEGETVVLIGPLPEIKDVNWQFTGRTPDQVIVSEKARFVVTDFCHQIAPFLMKRDYPNLIPNLMFEGDIVLHYLRDFSLWQNPKLLRAYGIKQIDGAVLGRWLAPTDFLIDHRQRREYAELPVIQKKGPHLRFFTPLSHFIEAPHA